ncbi:MAG: hypothetical protein M3O99_05395 [Chloroflexota bacterium]|nr:hypothetical protein [Chloroflexota bacterium]
MRDTAERSGITNAFTDPFRNCHAYSDTDKLTDRFALTDRASFVRTAERAIGNGRLGTRRGNAPLPVVGPRGHVE